MTTEVCVTAARKNSGKKFTAHRPLILPEEASTTRGALRQSLLSPTKSTDDKVQARRPQLAFVPHNSHTVWMEVII